MTANHLLESSNLSKTTGRINILETLLQSPSALSEREIEDRLKGICDRATIYRTLKLFVSTGIIHSIATESMVTLYILKREPKEHLHFKCEDCGSIICLPEVQIHQHSLPDGFKKKDASILITGICNACNK
jgi:Fur family transcriptional regulator, ferric uptake regulator